MSEKIKDETVWALKGPGAGAFEAHTLTSPQRDLNQAEWDALVIALMEKKEVVFCMSDISFGDYKKFQEDFCSYHPNECTYETEQRIATLFHRALALHKKAVKQ